MMALIESADIFDFLAQTFGFGVVEGMCLSRYVYFLPVYALLCKFFPVLVDKLQIFSLIVSQNFITVQSANRETASGSLVCLKPFHFCCDFVAKLTLMQ